MLTGGTPNPLHDERPPLTPNDFATLMAPLGPLPPDRRVVAGVSGGPDSMALAVLLRSWGDPLAVIVDHGLRPDSAEEAALTRSRLTRLDIESRIVRLDLTPGSHLAARARQARYAALLAVCAETGRPDLFLGHHARDQAETILLRRRARSGPAGLSGMASVAWRGPARLLRPLLAIDPARLRATLRQAGIAWAEDPGNTDPATARGALRLAPIPPQPSLGPARAQSDHALAAELARHVTLHPEGHARIHAPLSALAWSALIRTISGRDHPPGTEAVAALRARGAGTLHGVHIRDGWAMREPAAMQPPIPAGPGALWDGRFHLRTAHPAATIGALGPDSRRLRHLSPYPAALLRTLPAIRLDGKLLAVPHLAYPDAETCLSFGIDFRPASPLAGAPFRP